jgi:hypothetical protein
MYRASLAQDKALGQTYYSLPYEMCARAFEAFIQDSTIKNSFLVKGSKESEEARVGLYPQGEQRQRINRAFRSYFQALGQSLKRSERAAR